MTLRAGPIPGSGMVFEAARSLRRFCLLATAALRSATKCFGRSDGDVAIRSGDAGRTKHDQQRGSNNGH